MKYDEYLCSELGKATDYIKELENKIAELEKDNNFQADVMCDMGQVVMENKKLQAENLRLSTIVNNQKIVIEINQAENAILRECAEFYADTGSWYAVECSDTSIVSGVILESDCYETWEKTEISVGGKRARQCLRELAVDQVFEKKGW